MHANPGSCLPRPQKRPARVVAAAVAAAALILLPLGEAAAQFRGGFGGGTFGGGGVRGGGFGGGGFGRIGPASGRIVGPGGPIVDAASGGSAAPSKASTTRRHRTGIGSRVTGERGANLTRGGVRRASVLHRQAAGCRGGDCPRPKGPDRHPRRPGGGPVVIDVPSGPLPVRPLFVSPYEYVSSSLNSNLPPSGPAAGAQPPDPRRVSGVPPAGERRFVRDQIVAVLRDTLPEDQIDRFLRQHRLARTANGAQRLALINARVFRLRIVDGAAVPRVVAGLERDPRVVFVQPNYLFTTTESQEAPRAPSTRSATAADTAPPAADPLQYAIAKLQVTQAHKVARGERVLVAVIDSRVDAEHPELAGTIVKQIDVLNDKDVRAHGHGTAMAGAIVAKSRLMGIAPDARVVAVRAFTMTTAGSASSTSFDLAQAIDRAAAESVRVINLSFAGPADPILATSLKAARDKGIVLVAAAGNAGPKSPPLYPAADPNVIAVTATDAGDNVYKGANRGKYIAVAAPGVDVLVPAPQSNYELSTGTSVAAAHVSGVAALLLARNPSLNPDAVRKVLTETAHDLGPAGSREDYGAGLADAYTALVAAGAKADESTAAAGVPAH